MEIFLEDKKSGGGGNLFLNSFAKSRTCLMRIMKLMSLDVCLLPRNQGGAISKVVDTWASQVVQWWRIRQQCGRHGFDPWVGKIPWRRKWQFTLVFLPGKSQGQRRLAGHSPWDCIESDMTEHGRIHPCSRWSSGSKSSVSPPLLVVRIPWNLPS